MGKNNYFQFKQFTVMQEWSAMKVGTDGVLLGAWADPGNASRILDVGTGTGLIALMLAQRSAANITAIEIEKNAAEEARQNAAASPWGERVEVLNISFREFTATVQSGFDLIVSNPPFFSNDQKAPDHRRTLARHNDRLPFEELIRGAVRLLNANGRLAVILPSGTGDLFEKLSSEHGLFLLKKTEIKPKPSKKVNRVLLEFGKQKAARVTGSLTVYNEDGTWSEAYKNLTREFYLYI